METEKKIERWFLDNYDMDDYNLIRCENIEDLRRIVSDGSMETEIVTSVSDFLFNK